MQELKLFKKIKYWGFGLVWKCTNSNTSIPGSALVCVSVSECECALSLCPLQGISRIDAIFLLFVDSLCTCPSWEMSEKLDYTDISSHVLYKLYNSSAHTHLTAILLSVPHYYCALFDRIKCDTAVDQYILLREIYKRSQPALWGQIRDTSLLFDINSSS